MLSSLDLRSGADWLACAPQSEQDGFLNDLDDAEVLALPYLFEFWALSHQLPPEEDWRVWAVMGGRGAGKTRAGSEWVRAQIEGPTPDQAGKAKRFALVGDTYQQAQDVMVFGESGILACSPPAFRPEWVATKRRLVWENGAQAQVYSASDPEALRGPQFDGAWVDEFAKWKKSEEAWDMLQFCLRLGDNPQICATTTPRNIEVLHKVLAAPSSVVTHAPTEANSANLSPAFLAEVTRKYEGTQLGRQELDGELVTETEGALWSRDMLAEAVTAKVPELERVVIAVDPVVSHKKSSDLCGIVVAGVEKAAAHGRPIVYVLADLSCRAGSATGWAKLAVEAYHSFGAHRIVAEVNQGGDLVGEMLRQVDPAVPLSLVHARVGKAQRAEPVAALYEQGAVRHVRGLSKLEDQMCAMTRTGFEGKGSPDRVDALVWALHDLVLKVSANGARARIKTF